MTSPRIAPFGAWESPIGADRLAGATTRLGAVAADGPDTYWLEGRPTEGGRGVLVRQRADGSQEDVTGAPYSVRSRVHEYGGGAFAVSRGTVWFCNDEDQRIYSVVPGAFPNPVTGTDRCRFADLVPDLTRSRLIAVREDHSQEGLQPCNELVAIDLASGAATVLAQGHDFFSSPALSPDGRYLIWLAWDHPDMPWVSASVWLAKLDLRGVPSELTQLAGGPREAAFQPAFGPDGRVYFVSDRSGWWNLYRYHGGTVQPICTKQADFGRPLWQFGMTTYGFITSDRMLCCYCEHGRWQLATLDLAVGDLQDIECGLTSIDGLAVQGSNALVLGGAALSPSAVTRVNLDSGARTVLRASSVVDFDERGLSKPQAVSFPTGEDEVAHGFLYEPAGYMAGQALAGPQGARPPLLVVGHGGPTGATSAALDLKLQYWTSRGFAVLDVNYRGSTGYGRAYRDRLAGQWGVVDVEDCVLGARHFGREGAVDLSRMAIRGGSAGGYTALAALCFHDVFAAGASYYGISELEALARDTHKFESRYLDWLVGPYPQARERYRERSPIHFVERLSCPVIFFQGLEDKVVPPNQAEMMVAALERKGLPVAYLSFEGEQHGFRRAQTIRRTLEAELYFYGRIFRFTPAGDIEAVSISHLKN